MKLFSIILILSLCLIGFSFSEDAYNLIPQQTLINQTSTNIFFSDISGIELSTNEIENVKGGFSFWGAMGGWFVGECVGLAIGSSLYQDNRITSGFGFWCGVGGAIIGGILF